MGGIINNTFWIPADLASRWLTIPLRLGYAVHPHSVDLARGKWETQAAGVRRQIGNGYRPEKNIDASLVEKVIALDRSAVVVTGGTVIDVNVGQDLLHVYDATGSWWADMWVCGSATRDEFGYNYHVEYRQKHSDLVMSTLYFAFILSGSELALPKVIEKGLGWERIHYHNTARLLTCSAELATVWPEKLLDNKSKWTFTPLCPTPHPSKERYLSGSLGTHFRGVRIYSGPAFDPSSWEDSAFLAVEPYGVFPLTKLADDLIDKAIAHGSKLVVKSGRSTARSRSSSGTTATG
jgi:hypothetical protein